MGSCSLSLGLGFLSRLGAQGVFFFLVLGDEIERFQDESRQPYVERNLRSLQHCSWCSCNRVRSQMLGPRVALAAVLQRHKTGTGTRTRWNGLASANMCPFLGRYVGPSSRLPVLFARQIVQYIHVVVGSLILFSFSSTSTEHGRDMIAAVLKMRANVPTRHLAASLLVAVQLARSYSLDLTSEGWIRFEPGQMIRKHADSVDSVHQVSRSRHGTGHDVFLLGQPARPNSRVAPIAILL